MFRRPAVLVAALAAALLLSACGDTAFELDRGESAAIKRGAILFAERCSGCHSLEVVDADGSATQIGDRERVDGPDFNERCESFEATLYAIRNGGFSGAIMPENIVVGLDADLVARFLEKYAGRDAPVPCEVLEAGGE